MKSVLQKEIRFDTIIFIANKHKILLITTILFLLILLTYIFDFREYEYEYQRSKADEIVLQKNLVDKQKIIINLKPYQQQLEILQKQYHYMVQFLIQSNDMPVFFTQIEELAKQDQVSLQQVQPLMETKQEYFALLPCKIFLYGPYHSLATFITQLVNLDCVISIDHFILTTKSTSKENVADEKLQMELLLKVYLYPFDRVA